MKNQCKFDARKRDAKNMKNAQKSNQNGSQNREKVNQKRSPKIDAKKDTLWGRKLGGRPVGRGAPSNILIISRRLVFDFSTSR